MHEAGYDNVYCFANSLGTAIVHVYRTELTLLIFYALFTANVNLSRQYLFETFGGENRVGVRALQKTKKKTFWLVEISDKK